MQTTSTLLLQLADSVDSPSSQIGVVVGAVFGTLVVIGAILVIIITARRQMRGMPPDERRTKKSKKTDDPGAKGD